MRRVLLIGHCCLDDIYFVKSYPKEDSTVGSITQPNKCESQSWERGGNASNNATVLAVLNKATFTSHFKSIELEFFGTLARDHFFEIDISNCRIHDEHKSPTSVVICSGESGSRTIIHSNGNLPELMAEDFNEKIKLKNYDWIHFEGRNPIELTKMVKYIEEFNSMNPKGGEVSIYNYKNKSIPISIEVEKKREAITPLIQLADVVFVGSDHAKMNGATNPIEAAQIFTKRVQNGTLLVCPWGEEGAAYTLVGSEKVEMVNAVKPLIIVDSLGAGDTFNSSVIYGLYVGLEVKEALRFAVKVASKKLEAQGFNHLTNADISI